MVTPQLARLHQIAISVLDTDRAVRFYRDALGLHFLFTAAPGLAFFDCSGVRLMLSASSPQPKHTSTVLYFGVDDIHQAVDQLKTRGVAFSSEPQQIATLGDREIWLAGFEDSEGNTLALMSEPASG